jgi:hypothetical protein
MGRKKVTSFVSLIIEDITDIRRALRNNNTNTAVFPNAWKLDERRKKYIQQKATLDYILLDDFYTKLDERNESLAGDNVPQKLENLNKYLLQLADNALQKIDWEKFTS